MKPFFKTKLGSAFNCEIETFLDSDYSRKLVGKVDLIFTSPPFPLVSPKKYGNKVGEEYLVWLTDIVDKLSNLLKPKGSLVIEIGNAWTKGEPIMSLLPLQTLIAISERSNLHVCQQLIWHNPAKLPGPATWVNIKRERLSDNHTNIWWYSKTSHPKSNNKKVLVPYSEGMKKLLKTKKYNSGLRPSGHTIGEKSFLKNNSGAIAGSVISKANVGYEKEYREYCLNNDIPLHPARMPISLSDFFINFLTSKNDLVLDPFGGSCTTGKSAEQLGRKWIMVEKDKEYLKGASIRFKVK
jgi:DNA modification methylase